ncbi:trafficking protein particle complex subunit 8-like [Zingiber officinale]|uniref:trafficking protein particle complex subunit 8-like n=1 Tax=Zingiber officinale TaxID=94328 RepID=UPI001C4A932F|nr:trafficking protein particle complex subunit 8-like [Zingiber officinale]
MDPLKSYFGRLLQEEISPMIMVRTTPLAEDACQKNGLNFVELLLPFSSFTKLNVPVRTANDQPYRIQLFKLRLAYACDIHLQNDEVAEEHLKQVVLDANQNILPHLTSEPPELQNLLKKSDLCPSWIETFNKELIRTVSFSEHETFDHPVACLFVVSSKDEQPINRFVDLLNTDQFPPLLNDGVMDPKILKHYLVLHDRQDGSPDKVSNILAEMRSTFGSNCKFLCINSAEARSDDGKDVPWMPYGSHILHRDNTARLLSREDINGVRDFMQDLSSNYIIPHMEQKIRILNQQVAATRRGFRNQIKNLWWRKGKEDAPESPDGPTYTFSSIESQIRVLADYAFMLRDYELALSNYRLLSTDYKLDKAWKRYAGVQEMTGLCSFMLDQSRKDSDYCMETAFTTYLKIGSSSQRNASRCGLWWAEMLKARGQYKDAANIYFRISNEEPSLHAAVMLEQASYCYLLSIPPMLRKYGFHLVLSGNRYYISDQRHHAIRAYRNALFVYRENGWSYISDHVHYNVGRWYSFIGVLDLAIKHMLEVLACSHQSLATQNVFLNEFFHVVQSMGKKFEVYNLRLPVINMASLKVFYEDFRTYASPSDVHVSENLWQSLEEELVPSATTSRSNWLDSQMKSSSRRNNDSAVCVVGEAVVVELEFQNPLQVAVPISEISLICELTAKSEGTETGSSSLNTPPPDGDFESPYNSDSSFMLSKLDVILETGETKRIQLEVCPKMEGLLKITGVRWTLSDTVIGYRHFEFDMKGKQKKGRRDLSSLSTNLEFLVIKGLPKLEACIQHLPKKIFTGDLRPLLLELRNQSEFSVKNIKMKISHPRYLIPGNIEELNMDFPKYSENLESAVIKEAPATVIPNTKSFLFSFPDDAKVQGRACLTWPLWFHAGLTGKISLYVSIYYEVESCSNNMTYRILRMHHDLEILPSIDVSFNITPCKSSLHEFFVQMDIVNKTKSDSFSLHQLSSVGNMWEISALPTTLYICPVQTLLAGQALSCFFKLKDCRKNSSNEEHLSGCDLLMVSQDNKEVIDVSKSPMVEFHQFERHHQVKSSKGDLGKVDFILISKMAKTDPVIEPVERPKLLTNHTCHISISSNSPISWQMSGSRMINHDFSASFCEVGFHLRVQNCSDSVVSIRLVTYDVMPGRKHSEMAKLSDSSGNGSGWNDISLVNDIKVVSSVQGNRPKKLSMESQFPFIWCALSSTKLDLQPLSSSEIPLKICLFTPGTYDLSNYELHWELNPPERITGDLKTCTSGTVYGHPFYLTAIQLQH